MQNILQIHLRDCPLISEYWSCYQCFTIINHAAAYNFVHKNLCPFFFFHCFPRKDYRNSITGPEGGNFLRFWNTNCTANSLFKKAVLGFPGGAVVENPPANTGDTGSSPGLGRSHMPRSSWAREPQLLSLRVWSLCSTTREAAIVRGPRTVMKSGPRSPQLEKALAQKRRPNTAKNK